MVDFIGPRVSLGSIGAGAWRPMWLAVRLVGHKRKDVK
jgi:hypothetical protein